jgi:hypothetical protein
MKPKKQQEEKTKRNRKNLKDIYIFSKVIKIE